MPRVRLKTAGWTTFTGRLHNITFTNGVSDDDLTEAIVNRLAMNFVVENLAAPGVQIGEATTVKAQAFIKPQESGPRVRPVASNTLFRTPLIAFLGDSITAAGVSNTATALRNHNYSHTTWVPQLTGQRVRSRQDLNFGVAGDTTAMARARLSRVINCDADFVFVQIGTNDINNITAATAETTYRTCIENLGAIWDALITAGKVVLVAPPLPRNLATDLARRTLWRIINWVRGQRFSGRSNFFVVDTTIDYVDPLSTTGAPKTGFDYDGLHPQGLGGYQTAKRLAEVLIALFPQAPIVPMASVTDIYDAIYNPNGNLLLNGLLDGTTGTIANNQGSTGSGQLATSWQTVVSQPLSGGSALSALVVTAAKLAPTLDGRPQQSLRFSGTYTGDVTGFFGFRQQITDLTNFDAGDVLEGMMEVELSGPTLPIGALQTAIRVRYPSGATFYETIDGYGVANGSMPSEGLKVVHRTPRLTLTAKPNLIQFITSIVPRQGANAIDATLVMRSASLRKVS